MARRIKRLSYRSNPFPISVEQLTERDPGRWEKELKWRRGVGIYTRILLELLEGARVARGLYEEQLEATLRSPLTAHRPGEPWLQGRVLRLAGC